MYKEILSKINFDEREHSDNSYASEMEFCQRKTFYKFIGVPFQHNFSTEINFAQGNALHELLQETFITKIAPMLGFRAVKEVRIINQYIHGYIDLMMVNNEEIDIIEIKTTKQLPKEPMAHHISQLNIYMQPYVANQDKNHKKVKGILFYIEKAQIWGNSPQAEFVIDFNQELYDRAMSRAMEIQEAIKDRILPPAEAKLNGNSWECKYCSAFMLCKKAGVNSKELASDALF